MDNFEKKMTQKAEDFLADKPELKKQSEIREKNKIQFGRIFKEEDGLSESDTERRPCTQKEKERLNSSIEQLGDLFSGANFFWQLDGALSISLYRGDYIGVHKDVDISIDETELDKVEDFLEKKGYGFFLSTWNQDGERRIFERVGARRFKENKSLQPMIVSIDDDGKRIFDNAVSHIDTHVIRRDKNGSYIGHEFTKFPDNWFQPRIINFHGKEINCSHPALVAYYKLFHTRAYDDNDLKFLAQSGKLTKNDIDLIEKVFNQHVHDLQDVIRGFSDRIFSKISQGGSSQEIFEVMTNDELIKNMRSNNPETQKFLKILADKISKGECQSSKNLYDILYDTTPVSKLDSVKDAKFSILYENIPTGMYL